MDHLLRYQELSHAERGTEEHGVRAECFSDEPVPPVQKQDDAEHNPGQNNLHAADTVGFKSTQEEVSTPLMSIYP